MIHSTITSFSTREDELFESQSETATLLVAHAPPGFCTVDRCALSEAFAVGRDDDADLRVSDNRISKKHFQIIRDRDHWVIEDLCSKNGTFLNGARLKKPEPLPDPAVIRAGRTLFVFQKSGAQLLEPPPIKRFGIAGRFHVAAIVKSIEAASRSGRHIMLSGPSGVGKELTARALAAMMGFDVDGSDLVVHNAARFSSEEEAMVSIFGVGARVFSNVDARPGLIEKAKSGALFLDEIHNLPTRVQKGLLRLIEDGIFTRIGESKERRSKVSFIFATNAPPPDYGVAHDLLARLFLVEIPPLARRVADIPSIFDDVLSKRLNRAGIPEDRVLSLLSGNHYEAMCLDKFKRFNVRDLIDLADRLTSQITVGTPPASAVAEVFAKRFDDSMFAGRRIQSAPLKPSSYGTANATAPSKDESESENKLPSAEGASAYERNKDLIIRTFKNREENVAATERILKAQGIPCSRRWLSIYLKKWGARG